MVALILLALRLVAALFKSKSRLEAENAALRQQLTVLRQKDAPVSRPIQPIGRNVSHALVGGLHHRYAGIRVVGKHNYQRVLRDAHALMASVGLNQRRSSAHSCCRGRSRRIRFMPPALRDRLYIAPIYRSGM